MNIRKKNIRNILFLDIETAGIANSYQDLSATKKNHWIKKSERFNRLPGGNSNPSESFENKAGIFAEFGRIVCISVGYLKSENDSFQLRIKSFYNENERELILDFLTLVGQHFGKSKGNFLVGHNIREFDIPFICRRAIVHKIPLPQILKIQGSRPWENKFIIDTLELWRFGDFKNYTSLDLLSNLFSIKSPKDDLDGSRVHGEFYNGNIESIVNYCEGDVETLARVFLRIAEMPEVEKFEALSKTKFYKSERVA